MSMSLRNEVHDPAGPQPDSPGGVPSPVPGGPSEPITPILPDPAPGGPAER
jgi:hypothetical protein